MDRKSISKCVRLLAAHVLCVQGILLSNKQSGYVILDLLYL